jgi:hypothetical protein
MPLYFLLFDPGKFNKLARPLGEGWARRALDPVQLICRDLRAAADKFADRFGMTAGDLLITQALRGVALDRNLWRTLIGEILLMSAEEVPEIETAPQTLTCLLAPDRYRERHGQRECYSPIEQAHFGSRDLVFGQAYYRPDHAGWNDVEDVARLTQYLGGIDSAAWQVSDLAELRDIASEDRADELDYACQCFRALQNLYRGAQERGHIVVCEEI